MKVFVHKSERSRITGWGTFFSFLLVSGPSLHQGTFSAHLDLQQVGPLARFSDDFRWTRWEMHGTPRNGGMLVGLLTILISFSLVLQGQPGLQSPMNFSMFLFSQTVCLSPDPPQALAIPGMTLVFIKQPFGDCRGKEALCCVSAHSGWRGGGEMRAALETSTVPGQGQPLYVHPSVDSYVCLWTCLSAGAKSSWGFIFAWCTCEAGSLEPKPFLPPPRNSSGNQGRNGALN